ncbi:MAG TPA: hypothetical protein VF053_00830 [Streptosporangiales bacterium]
MTLTTEGTRLAHRVHNAVVKRLAETLDGVSAADEERLTSLLTRFTHSQGHRGA